MLAYSMKVGDRIDIEMNGKSMKAIVKSISGKQVRCLFDDPEKNFRIRIVPKKYQEVENDHTASRDA